MQFAKLKIMADPYHKGVHPLHDHRYITTADCQFDDVNHAVESGLIVAKMTDLENQKEYARLFVAAPDLLEACKLIAEWNDKYPSDNIYNHTEIIRIAADMDAINLKVLAAIAKTEGQK